MKNNSRRDFIKKGTVLTVGASLLGTQSFNAMAQDKKDAFSLPPLPYDYNALEPYIDEATMRIHHTKHHQAYVNNLNAAVAKHAGLEKRSLEDLLLNIESLPADVKNVIRNNGGGHWNHDFFWKILTPKKNTKPSEQLQKAIAKDFPSFDIMKEEFSKAAGKVFGSGWAWIIVTKEKSLKIVATANQDNPLMTYSAEMGMPILGIDVWEHAYYLKHQNMRTNYIKDFWNVVNWTSVNEAYLKATK
jgi:superoxide dismutase, Fe-Mn family